MTTTASTAKARERTFVVISGLSAIGAFVALFASGLRAMALTVAVGTLIYSGFELVGHWRLHWRGLRWLLALLGSLALLALGVFWPNSTPNVPLDQSSPTDSSPPVSAPGSISTPQPGMILDRQVSILPGKGVDLDTGEVDTSDLIQSETDLYLPDKGADVFPGLSSDRVYPVLGPTGPATAVHELCVKAPETVKAGTGSRFKDARACFTTSRGHIAWYWVKGVDPDTQQVIFHIRVWK